jgi:Mrp family chromosome partitioning ATPase
LAPNSAQRASSPAPTLDELWAELSLADLDARLLRRNRVVTYDSGPDSSAFDILRTKVLLQMRKNGWRRLAITSPTPVCGKSTVTCNLALGLSRQSDLRTIVIELDLHNPSMARILGLNSDRDVTEMIDGDISFAEQAFRVRSNVAISLARRATSDPTRHLLSQAMEDRLAEIEDIYAPDLMLFDVPPLLVSDDTRAFLGKVDCALILARAEKTTIGQIDACEREVAEHTNVLGVVLNQARFADQDGGYAYNYGN